MSKIILGYIAEEGDAKRMEEFQISPETNECLKPIYKKNKIIVIDKIKKQFLKKYFLKYPWMKHYFNARRRCKDKKFYSYKYYGKLGIKCLINRVEIEERWYKDKAYKMKKPTLSRSSHDKDYTFKNARFIENSNNIAERNKRVCSKKIEQYDLEGNFIKEWESQSQIERWLGYDQGNISNVCRGKYKQSYGFVWRFKDAK